MHADRERRNNARTVCGEVSSMNSCVNISQDSPKVNTHTWKFLERTVNPTYNDSFLKTFNLVYVY